ncbi:hypothetical protein LL912_17250 [Niabella sp. CC-SYL272]|uniref:DoxX family protein n=1 Tax=Niabella agricola TaxID=2891571 RepID=UPI001F16C612|nr:hypothetical protein [Niabella agricola]MCF3110537.1 hypothetical protein [Niabella agricola]
MKPLMVLLVTFAIAAVISKLMHRPDAWALSGRIAMVVMLVFTATAHFVFTKGMSMMLPSFIPGKAALVYSTGVMEMVAAVALLIPALRLPAAWFLVLFLVLLLPANVYAALKHVDYQKASFHGNGPAYLWFRVPLQLFFIAWIYLSAIKA